LLESRSRKPLDTISEFAAVLQSYGLSEVTGDKYAAGFVVDGFSKAGLPIVTPS
jgi:hypothetical protein